MDETSQMLQMSQQHPRCYDSPCTQFEVPETMALEDGSTGRLTEFTARLESDGSWYYKMKYWSPTSGGSKVRIIRRT